MYLKWSSNSGTGRKYGELPFQLGVYAQPSKITFENNINWNKHVASWVVSADQENPFSPLICLTFICVKLVLNFE